MTNSHPPPIARTTRTCLHSAHAVRAWGLRPVQTARSRALGDDVVMLFGALCRVTRDASCAVKRGRPPASGEISPLAETPTVS